MTARVLLLSKTIKNGGIVREQIQLQQRDILLKTSTKVIRSFVACTPCVRTARSNRQLPTGSLPSTALTTTTAKSPAMMMTISKQLPLSLSVLSSSCSTIAVQFEGTSRLYSTTSHNCRRWTNINDNERKKTTNSTTSSTSNNNKKESSKRVSAVRTASSSTTNKNGKNGTKDKNDTTDKIEEEEGNNINNSTNDNEGSKYETIFPPGVHYTDEEIEAIVAQEEAIIEEEIQSKFIHGWTPGKRKRPLQMTYKLEEFEYELEPEKYINRWTLLDKRCGGLGIKIGMVPVFDDVWGVRHPCTVLYMDTNIVLGHKTMEKHGYSAIQVGAGERKVKNVGKSVLGQYKHITDFLGSKPIFINDDDDDEDDDEEEEEEKKENQEDHDQVEENDTTNEGLEQGKDSTTSDDAVGIDTDATTTTTALKATMKNPPYIVREFRITNEDNLIPIGCGIHARHFVPGQNLDVSGISKGKGFQGGMKRHNFKGMPASHGTSVSHRAIGSVGSCQDPGKVFKGKKMPGRMGSDRVTVQNLRLLKIDRGRNLLYVIGAVPGNPGTFVEIRDAVKKPLWNRPDKVGTDCVVDGTPPLPTYPYNPRIDGTGLPGYEVYMPMPTSDPVAPDYEEFGGEPKAA